MERVIIVDDELLFQNYLEKYISRFEDVEIVAKFENGKRAIEYLKTDSHITIAFVDILMPVMSGLELARWINENLPATKVVLISAHQDFKYAQEAIRANVYHYLSKPLKYTELEGVLRDIAKERLADQKNRLLYHDLKRERKDLELYHSTVAGETLCQRADWVISIPQSGEVEYTDSMISTAVRNVIRYCASSLAVVISCEHNQVKAILLAQHTEKLPTVAQFVAKFEALTDVCPTVSVRYEGMSCNKNAESERNCGDPESDALIQRSIDYIMENLATDFSRDDIAEYVYMSPSHFSRFFKRETGVPFQEYLKKARIARVIELLEKDWNVQDAYQAAGFQNRNYFNEVFRKEVGCSPSEYKRRQKYKREEA